MRADYGYDVFGNCIEKEVDEDGDTTVDTHERYAYDGFKPGSGFVGNENWDIWADLDDTSSLTTRYVRGNAIDQLFSRIDSGGTAAHYFGDHLGSVRHMTDGNGTLQNTIAYDGFGNITSESSPSFGDRYTYASRERDVETGFYYNRARYYNPEVGRWTSEDPIGFGAGDSNLYRYVTNQPTKNTDPSGLQDNDEVYRLINKHIHGDNPSQESERPVENNPGRVMRLMGDRYQTSRHNGSRKTDLQLKRESDTVQMRHRLRLEREMQRRPLPPPPSTSQSKRLTVVIVISPEQLKQLQQARKKMERLVTVEQLERDQKTAKVSAHPQFNPSLLREQERRQKDKAAMEVSRIDRLQTQMHLSDLDGKYLDQLNGGPLIRELAGIKNLGDFTNAVGKGEIRKAFQHGFIAIIDFAPPLKGPRAGSKALVIFGRLGRRNADDAAQLGAKILRGNIAPGANGRIPLPVSLRTPVGRPVCFIAGTLVHVKEIPSVAALSQKDSSMLLALATCRNLYLTMSILTVAGTVGMAAWLHRRQRRQNQDWHRRVSDHPFIWNMSD